MNKPLSDKEVLAYLQHLDEDGSDSDDEGSFDSSLSEDEKKNKSEEENAVESFSPEEDTIESLSPEDSTNENILQKGTNENILQEGGPIENVVIFDGYIPISIDCDDFISQDDVMNFDIDQLDIDNEINNCAENIDRPNNADTGGTSSTSQAPAPDKSNVKQTQKCIFDVGGTSLATQAPANTKVRQKRKCITDVSTSSTSSVTPAPGNSKVNQIQKGKVKKKGKISQRKQAIKPKAKKPKAIKTNHKKNNKKKPKKKKEKPEFVWKRFPSNPKKFKLNTFTMNGNTGTGTNVPNDVKTPLDFFSLFLSNELIDLIVSETNRYAEQSIIHGITDETIFRESRLNKWTAVTTDEIKTFFGILIWMGLDKKPSMYRYWSSNVLYQSPVRKYMSRNRFQAILSMLHVTNNETTDKNDKLNKLGTVLNYLNDRFHQHYTPGETVCIDETMMPWRGRLGFRQYIPSKRHKYGIKFFKLCLPHGYTHRFKIYIGAEGSDSDAIDQESGLSVGLSERVVLHLCQNILDNGRTLYTDNFYTSVSLAKSLLNRNTHLVGTLRSNRKHNPKSVIKHNLVKGQMIGKVSQRICVYKWLDKCDVMFLSMKHKPGFSEVKVNRYSDKTFMKPNAIIDYNQAKTFIDVSDQLKSYASALRRGVKWYRKVLIEVICNTSMVNSYILCLMKTGRKIEITEFREKVAISLFEYANLDADLDDGLTLASPTSRKHMLQETPKRGRCVTCYALVSKRKGRPEAMKLPFIHLYCSACPQKFMCLNCYNKSHYSKLLSRFE